MKLERKIRRDEEKEEIKPRSIVEKSKIMRKVIELCSQGVVF